MRFMSTENNQTDNGMRLFVSGRSQDRDRLIKATEQQLNNTKLFLERLHQGEEKSRRYVEKVKATFENDLRRFRRNRSERE